MIMRKTLTFGLLKAHFPFIVFLTESEILVLEGLLRKEFLGFSAGHQPLLSMTAQSGSISGSVATEQKRDLGAGTKLETGRPEGLSGPSLGAPVRGSPSGPQDGGFSAWP